MSQLTGDKSRHNRQRKEKFRKRVLSRALRAEALAAAADPPITEKKAKTTKAAKAAKTAKTVKTAKTEEKAKAEKTTKKAKTVKKANKTAE